MEEDQDEQATVAELKEAFRLYDREGNGYISTEVFREILHELDENLSPEELDMMIEEIDADGSGTLDFDGKIFIFLIVNIIKANVDDKKTFSVLKYFLKFKYFQSEMLLFF